MKAGNSMAYVLVALAIKTRYVMERITIVNKMFKEDYYER